MRAAQDSCTLLFLMVVTTTSSTPTGHRGWLAAQTLVTIEHTLLVK